MVGTALRAFAHPTQLEEKGKPYTGGFTTGSSRPSFCSRRKM